MTSCTSSWTRCKTHWPNLTAPGTVDFCLFTRRRTEERIWSELKQQNTRFERQTAQGQRQLQETGREIEQLQRRLAQKQDELSRLNLPQETLPLSPLIASHKTTEFSARPWMLIIAMMTAFTAVLVAVLAGDDPNDDPGAIFDI